MDLVPVKLTLEQSDFCRDHFLPTHIFIADLANRAPVRISYLEPKWLERFLAKNPAAIRHEAG